MGKECKICVVIVTYNRKEYLIKLLEGLRQQSRHIDAILIFDNYSNDGTGSLLVKHKYTEGETAGKLYIKEEENYKYYYFKNECNCGGSGGFYQAIKLAINFDYDFLWCMDDDVYPDSNCLNELLKHMSSANRICIPTRQDQNYTDYAITKVDMSNPFKYSIVSRKTMMKNDRIGLDAIHVVDMPFEGPLIAVDLIEQIGLPKSDFFIIFDDSEYAARANQYTDILYCKNAILHKQIIPVSSHTKLMNWKNYYGYRNQIWFDRHYANNIFVKIVRPRLLLLDLVLRALIQGKWSNLKIITAAYSDGMHNRLGKLVEPGVTAEKFRR